MVDVYAITYLDTYSGDPTDTYASTYLDTYGSTVVVIVRNGGLLKFGSHLEGTLLMRSGSLRFKSGRLDVGG